MPALRFPRGTLQKSHGNVGSPPAKTKKEFAARHTCFGPEIHSGISPENENSGISDVRKPLIFGPTDEDSHHGALQAPGDRKITCFGPKTARFEEMRNSLILPKPFLLEPAPKKHGHPAARPRIKTWGTKARRFWKRSCSGQTPHNQSPKWGPLGSLKKAGMVTRIGASAADSCGEAGSRGPTQCLPSSTTLPETPKLLETPKSGIAAKLHAGSTCSRQDPSLNTLAESCLRPRQSASPAKKRAGSTDS